jgi:DNA-binding transcriptional regulator LsrR (DeoR family)
LSYSRQIAAMASHVQRLPYCDVVQLAGHLLQATDPAGSPEVVRRVAAASGGTWYPIYCPMLVANRAVATALRQQTEIADALDRGQAVDRAVVSIGAWGPGLSGIYQAVSAREQRRGASLGVCGEISGRLFDADGNPVTNLLDDRIVALTLDQFRALPQVLASCFGAERAEAARVAAAGGLVDVLVTDTALATRLVRG